MIREPASGIRESTHSRSSNMQKPLWSAKRPRTADIDARSVKGSRRIAVLNRELAGGKTSNQDVCHCPLSHVAATWLIASGLNTLSWTVPVNRTV